MLNTRLYIIQIIGILMLLCGYFISDQPDSLSVMHFDPNPACPSVITKAIKSTPNDGFLQMLATSSSNNSPHKTNVTKHISYETILQHFGVYYFPVAVSVLYSYALPENYDYLFYREINPPPPKCC